LFWEIPNAIMQTHVSGSQWKQYDLLYREVKSQSVSAEYTKNPSDIQCLSCSRHTVSLLFQLFLQLQSIVLFYLPQYLQQTDLLVDRPTSCVVSHCNCRMFSCSV
jgi:hypothetical protein